MTNVRSWNERLRSELREQWWQTLTVILALGLGAGLWLAFTGGDDSAQATTDCTTGKAVSSPAANPGLVADCEALLALRDELRGTGALNWSADTPIQQWKGVSSRERVVFIVLVNADLTGNIPAGLGKLDQLRYLDLRFNKLTGSIPAELGDLPNLAYLRLSWNPLSGCVPPALRKVGFNDLVLLKLSDCGTATATATATATTPPATATATATAAPEASYSLTITQAANGRLTAPSGTGPFKASSNTDVVVRATPGNGYELAAWGGDCAGRETTSGRCVLSMSADRSVTATFRKAAPPKPSGPLTLIVISKGDADAVTLEWTGGPSNATRWQYRTRTWSNYQPQAWDSWTNIPNSGATTRSYRVTGLRADVAYDAQVRAVVGTTAGAASNVGEGHTYRKGSTPYIDPGQIVEGDGKTEWRVAGCGCVIVIPDGMRVRGVTGGISDQPRYSVQDVATGSYLTLTVGGREVGREINTRAQGGDAQDADVRMRDVGKLFDQIADSARPKLEE